MIGCLRTHVRNQPIIALYFEFENELKFVNLEACTLEIDRKKQHMRRYLSLYQAVNATTSLCICYVFPAPLGIGN